MFISVVYSWNSDKKIFVEYISVWVQVELWESRHRTSCRKMLEEALIEFSGKLIDV